MADELQLSFDEQIALALRLSAAEASGQSVEIQAGDKIKQDFREQETTSPSKALPSRNAGDELPSYVNVPPRREHKNNYQNKLSQAATLRGRDEQEMQNRLIDLQWRCGIYNEDVEPEHETESYCYCEIHHYMYAKARRVVVQNVWSEATMYSGEKAYTESGGLATAYGGPSVNNNRLFNPNPYNMIVSPFGYFNANSWSTYGRTDIDPRYICKKPVPKWYTRMVQDIIATNNRLNRKAQERVDAMEPTKLWSEEPDIASPTMPIQSSKNGSRLSRAFSKIGITPSEVKETKSRNALRHEILNEENGRWSDPDTRNLAKDYLKQVGMFEKVNHLRETKPIEYLHLLRAGYFEPIPTDWCTQNSNPLKFSIDAPSGWRGITPQWRGYEDTAEERLYYVLNHRTGAGTSRIKPDPISELQMAKDRIARAVEPPPQYFSPLDTCHVQHFSEGYSKQVMPPPYDPIDGVESTNDDTMVLLDVSGSMSIRPIKPVYSQLLIERYVSSEQPRNKDVAKSILRRFTDAMINHDPSHQGYDLVTFSTRGRYVGRIGHRNFDDVWNQVQWGGGTRVMTGWQQVKELHFTKHAHFAYRHPDFGWQALPGMPRLRLLLFLDGEANDMDEFELDLLAAGDWAHLTVFLIGADGCPHHHRHANELERISSANHHVSFVDAQGAVPERFVTHELLKRHLGYDMAFEEFQRISERSEQS